MLKSVRDTLDKVEDMTGNHYFNSIYSGGFDEFITANDMDKAEEYLDFVNITTFKVVGILYRDITPICKVVILTN